MVTSTEFRIGNRIIRAGEVVKVTGERGSFVVRGFDLDAGSFDCFGGTPGPKGRRSFRTFRLDRIGARPVEENRRRRATSTN